MEKEAELVILRTIESCLGDNFSEDRWMDPMMDHVDIIHNFGGEGRRVGYNQLLIKELHYADIEEGQLATDADIGNYVLERLKEGTYDEGVMRIYGISVGDNGNFGDNIVSMCILACGIGSDSESIFPDFIYNETAKLWISVEGPYDRYPWILVLSFDNYTRTLFDLLWSCCGEK